MTILTKDKPAASRQKIGHHNHKNRYGSDVPDDEIHRGEDRIGSLQHPLVGEFPADIGLLHLPADKYHYQQGSESHKKVGGEHIEKIEQDIPENLHS